MNFNSKLNPFANYNEPKPPDWYKTDSTEWVRWLGWFFYRNPLHNFMFYWLGFKDSEFDYTQIWNTKKRLNMVLPFISYRGKKWEFYIGWRPDKKVLGFAMRRKKYGY